MHRLPQQSAEMKSWYDNVKLQNYSKNQKQFGRNECSLHSPKSKHNILAMVAPCTFWNSGRHVITIVHATFCCWSLILQKILLIFQPTFLTDPYFKKLLQTSLDGFNSACMETHKWPGPVQSNKTWSFFDGRIGTSVQTFVETMLPGTWQILCTSMSSHCFISQYNLKIQAMKPHHIDQTIQHYVASI